jgi:hypothetical protein
MTRDHQNHDKISSATGTAVMIATAHRNTNLAKNDTIMWPSLSLMTATRRGAT